MPTYAVRAPLARWLAAEAARAGADLGPYRLLDVGCGEMPYLSLFRPHVREVVGMDTWDNPRASLKGVVESIPADDAAQGVRELARVTRPGGRVLLSTHGAMVYHPNPVDLWRWTGAGLERLFTANGDWASVTVSAGSGTASSLAMLNAIYLEHVLRRTPLRVVRGPIVGLLNRAARALDRRVAQLRDERPGTIAANYHVVAERTS